MGYKPPAIVTEAVHRWDESKKHHDLFVREYERRERAYHGLLSPRANAAKWRHNYTPRYAFNLIETIVANTVEMGLRFDVRPSPHLQASMEEAIRAAAQAEVIGELLRHEHRVDEMEFKQRPLFLSAAICGIGIGKSYWNYVTGPRQRQVVKDRPIYDEETGEHLFSVPVVEQEKTLEVVRDHSTFEVLDPRDFVLHESAKTLQPLEPGGAQYVFHRCWYSYEQLKMQEAAGFLKDVERLKDHQIDFSGEYVDRETKLWDVNRTKDLIEVLEYWKFEDGVVKRALVGNRAVELRALEESPFAHGQYPFVITSTMPNLFSTKGTSDIELIEQLQEMLWEIGNQRLDNLELVNNAIFLIRSDVQDEDAFEFYPGARWPVESTDQVVPLQPPYQAAQVSMEAEALIKGDLQNVTSAAPFASGTQLAEVQQTTATGASIVMNAAQQRMIMKKYIGQQGLRQEANMRIKNCQQFISDTRLLHILGPEGRYIFREIDPLQIQGEFVAELEPMGESNMRQERRSEAMQFATTLINMVPALSISGLHIDGAELIKWMGRQWGIDDVERFFSKGAPVQMPGAPAMPGAPEGGPGGTPQGLEGPNLGITSESAIDASKPSAAGGIGSSPVMALQRALAMGGGANNQ